MKSTRQKLLKLEGLLDTSDLNDFEQSFLSRWVPQGLQRTAAGQPTNFSEKVEIIIDQIYAKNFGD